MSHNSDSHCNSKRSSKSDSHHKESDYHNRKVVDELQEQLMNEMNMIYKKYGLDQELVRLLVELDINPDTHNKIKINRLFYRNNFYKEQRYFAEKQKKQDKVYVVPMHPKVL